MRPPACWQNPPDAAGLIRLHRMLAAVAPQRNAAPALSALPPSAPAQKADL